MEFDNYDSAWQFWKDYGAKMGFGVRKEYTNKKKDGTITSCRFVCCKEGTKNKDKREYLIVNPRHETRTNCKFVNRKLRVIDFVDVHNHILHLVETTHMLQC